LIPYDCATAGCAASNSTYARRHGARTHAPAILEYPSAIEDINAPPRSHHNVSIDRHRCA
jgi:hypothetical protein